MKLYLQTGGLGLMLMGLCTSLYPLLPWISLSLSGLLLYWLAGGKGFELHPNTRTLLLWLGLSLLPGSLISSNYGSSAKGLYDLARGLLAGISLCILFATPLRQRFLLSLLGATLAVALLQHIPLMDGLLRNHATYQLDRNLFGHPARLASTCALWLLVCWSAPQRDSYRRASLFLLTAVSLSLLLVAGARGSMLALAATGMVYFSWQAKSIMWRCARLLLSLATLPIALIATGALLDRGIADSGRYQLWQHTFYSYLESPWFGLGNNTFKNFPNNFLEGFQLQMPHNIFLELLFSGGPVAVMLFLYAFSRWLYLSLVVHRKQLMNITPLIFLLILGMVDLKLFSTIFGMYLGMALAIANVSYDRANT